MYQQGSTNLASGATSVAVTFATPFTTTPQVILAAVANTSGDVSKILIEAGVTAKSTTGFTASFDLATDSTNYKLMWLAGDLHSMLSVFSALRGKALSQYPNATSMDDDFSLALLTLSPLPRLKLLPGSVLWNNVVRQAAEIPSAPGNGVRPGFEMIADSNNGWLYLSDGQRWGRTPAEFPAAWTDQPFYVPFREAEVTLNATANQLEYDIEFNTPFTSGNAPKVMVQVADVSAGAKAQIYAMVTDRSLSGFSINLSGMPLNDDGETVVSTQPTNLKIYYMARQLP